MTMVDTIISIRDLSFNYFKRKKALDNLSINVPKGSIYGFLGPNGAGKSTTMRMLTGLIHDPAENIYLFGKPLKEQTPHVFSRMGCLVESPALYLHLTGRENLLYIAQLRKVSIGKIDEALELVELTDNADLQVKKYSLGMKQRLAIAMTLLGDPELLLLDEPVNGLDPTGIAQIRRLLIQLNQERGTTIFISSHLLNEIEKMCTHIGILHQGKLQFEGTMQQLSQRAKGCRVQLELDEASKMQAQIMDKYTIEFAAANQMVVQLENRQRIPDLIQDLAKVNARIYNVRAEEGLEEWFINLTRE